MTERSDITVDWGLSPRLIEVALPSVELSNQDLHDTLNSNTLQPGQSDDSLENMDDDPLIDSAGKEDLGGGVEVGITSTLLDGQVAFGRTAPRTGAETISTASADGKTVTAAAASFVTDSCQRGDWVINWSDQSVTEILAVNGEGSLRCRALSGGTTNLFNLNDVITVWEVAECELSGGNTVAVDTVPASINPLFTTFGRFATRASASSATTANQEALNFSTYQNRVTVDVINGTAGTAFPQGTPQAPVNNLTDAQTIAVANGFTTLSFIGNFTFLASDNVDSYRLIGQGRSLSILTFVAGVSTVRSIVDNAEVTGDLAGAIELVDCHIVTLTGLGGSTVETNIIRCLLEPGTAVTMTAGATEKVNIRNCDSGSPGDTPVTFDWNGTGADAVVRKYDGGFRIINATGGQEISFGGDMHLTIEASCTDATLAVRGDVKITNNAEANPSLTLIDQGTHTKLLELWARLGLDPANPMTTNDDNSVTVGGITIGAVNGPTDTVQTRTGASL